MIQEIKDFINQNIKENGKGGITGKILNSVLNKIADALPTSASAGLKNLVDGEADGSVRGINAAEETEEYKLGQYSVAEGYNTKASGDRAHAEGAETKATGWQAHAEGYSTEAEYCCHAEGSNTKALQNCSHAEGYSTEASGAYSHAEGNGTKASGYATHAEGSYTKASFEAAHAEGYSSEANGYAAHAEGSNTKANGSNSHSEGYGTKAEESTSHAEGWETQALGMCSHAEGNRTIAEGYASHASGNETIAKGYYQTAIGTYNKEIDAYFSVGDGGYNNRSDAFRVEKDSRVMVKNSAGEEVHLQDFEPRSCIIRWQPQSEISADGYYYYHDLVYMPFFADIADGETWVVRLNWMYEHQVDMDNAELAEGEEAVSYIGAERLCTTITATKVADVLNVHAFTKVVDSTRNSEDIHQNRFHTPQVRYVWSDTDALSRQSRVYLQDYIFSERYESDKVGTHFRFTIENATLNGKIMPLSNFIFADNTGNVDYSKDENGNVIRDSSSMNNGYNKDYIDNLSVKVKARCGNVTKESSFQISRMLSDHEITIDVPEQDVDVDVIKELEAANLLGAMQGKSVCRQTTAAGYAVMASIFQKEDSSLGDYKCVLVFGYAGQDNDGNIKEFGELTIDLRNGFDLTYSGSNKSELKVKKYDGIMYQSTISIMSNCKANEFRALYLKSSVQIDAKQTEPLLTFNVPASKGYITAVVADSSVQGQSTYINQVASVAEQIADKLPYANPFYYSDYSTDYYDAETQTLTLLEGRTMAHIYPTEPLMVKHIVLPEVKTGQRLAIYGNWIPVVEDGDEQEGRFSSVWRTDVANGFEDLIYLNGQWINKA